MLKTYRRHRKRCEHRSQGGDYGRCQCPIWVRGLYFGNEVYQSLGGTEEEAENELERLKKRLKSGASPVNDEPVTVQQAWEQFLCDAEARSLREPTLRKYRHLKRQMEEFAGQRGMRFLRDLNVEALREFRAAWPNRNLSALKKLELLRAFFHFAQDSGWTADNPAKKVKNPKVTDRPTLPFTQDEMILILAAFDKLSVSPLTRLRLRALVLLLRYSGLRISDAVTLARSGVLDGKLFLYTSKAGTPVHCPLPAVVIQALDLIPASGPYFFWTGQSKPKTAISHWQCQLSRLMKLAEVEGGHAHRFRDTFAVELLLQGVPLERVSVLLGHRSIRVTERHYAPWVLARQEQLEADVRRTWPADAVALIETKRARGVHGGSGRVN